MSHYEKRLEHDLREIRARVRATSDLVEAQVRDAVQALLTQDHELANRVILQDRIVNRETRALDHICHGFVVRHLPVAHHLRYVSAVLRIDVLTHPLLPTVFPAVVDRALTSLVLGVSLGAFGAFVASLTSAAPGPSRATNA